MRAILILIMGSFLPLFAQQPEAPKQEAPKQETKNESPVPSAEAALSGSVDLGYRWRTDVAGSPDAYRSVVNLGSGPKLLGSEFTLTDARKRLFDQVHVRAYSWGDDPYGTLHVDARKARLYDLTADYRDMAYFNFLPSFADPLLARGIPLNEQSFDMHRRFAGFSLDLLPGNWFVPYLAFDRDSGSGTGASVLVTDGNEFPVPNQMRDRTNLYRGGVRVEWRRIHATVEEGRTTFKDDQSLFGGPNPGNNRTPVLGRMLTLSSLLATYGIRGDSTFSKGLFTANATPWLDLYGNFLYSQPNTDVNYQQVDTGNLLLQSQALFYTSQRYLVSAAAKLPHTSGGLGAEMRPSRRLRVMESWLTDRLHNAGSAAQNQLLATAGQTAQFNTLLSSSLITNYSQQEINVIFDATPKLTLRGGHRYVWGDASEAVLPAAGVASADQGTLRRQVGLGAIIFRPSRKLFFLGEAEEASSSGSYFRTSLYNYQKVRAQGRYQATGTLSLSADFTLLNNQNPTPGVDYDYRAQQASLSVLWSPAGGKTWDFQGTYTRSSLRSNSGYLEPEDLSVRTLLYRENAHTATALFNLKPRANFRFAPRITAGGSFFFSSGSRPSGYYQPLGKLSLPLANNLNLFTEWRYYGYGETFYLYEGFRTHMLTAGLRLTR